MLGGHPRNPALKAQEELELVVPTRLESWRNQQRPARDHCMAPGRSVDAPLSGHRYTRMFPDLPHLSIGPDVVHALGRAGGACDTRYSTRGESESVAAGWTVFGQFIALVGDPRQDVHLLISQMHVAMLKAHNRLVDRLREDGVSEADLVAEARRALTWHYQWAVLFDFLPATIGEERTRKLLQDGPRFFQPDGTVSIPFEFADAAYRFGHSQMRGAYRVQRGGADLTLFPDLIGFRPVTSDRLIDWSLLFDVAGEPAAARSRPIDGCLAEPLLKLPVDITGELDDQDFQSRTVRELQRGVATGLPSGEAVARLVGEEPLLRDEVGLSEFGWSGETPLWYYLLKEAEVREGGERLGPVGSL